MKVYTYYEDINRWFEKQDELLAIWKKSWESKGFETIVLTRADAEKHSFYNEFVNRLNLIHEKIIGKPVTRYGMACWLRWLAYATLDEEKFYVCDYDVINHSFNPTDPVEELCLLDGDCPCIASGKPSQFLQLCKKFLKISEDNIDSFINEKDKLIIFNKNGDKISFPHFHDQEFFIFCKKINLNVVKMTRERDKFLSVPIIENFWQRQVVHYGLNLCVQYCEKNGIDYHNHDAKIKVIEKHLV